MHLNYLRSLAAFLGGLSARDRVVQLTSCVFIGLSVTIFTRNPYYGSIGTVVMFIVTTVTGAFARRIGYLQGYAALMKTVQPLLDLKEQIVSLLEPYRSDPLYIFAKQRELFIIANYIIGDEPAIGCWRGTVDDEDFAVWRQQFLTSTMFGVYPKKEGLIIKSTQMDMLDERHQVITTIGAAEWKTETDTTHHNLDWLREFCADQTDLQQLIGILTNLDDYHVIPPESLFS